MNRPVLSKEIHRRLMLTIHQDGLLDVLAGLIIATFGIVPLLDNTGMNPGVRQVIFLSCYLVEVVSVLWLKRAVTSPRTGMVTLSRRTSTRISLILLGINTFIFLVFLLSYLFKWSLWENLGSFQLSVPLGLIFLILLTSLGAILKASRFYLYGILVMAIFMGGEYFFNLGILGNHGIPPSSFMAGGIMVLSGGIHLYNFLKKYPVDRG
jgi:hypothetical protein